jgi:hypothetical protein
VRWRLQPEDVDEIDPRRQLVVVASGRRLFGDEKREVR